MYSIYSTQNFFENHLSNARFHDTNLPPLKLRLPLTLRNDADLGPGSQIRGMSTYVLTMNILFVTVNFVIVKSVTVIYYATMKFATVKFVT